MKPLFTILLSILFISKCMAQVGEFAPVGAKWWYNFNSNSYYFVESKHDTIFNGIPCRTLRSQIISATDTTEVAQFYIYQSNDSVFYALDTTFNVVQTIADKSFHLLYNFNAVVGDTWDLFIGDFNPNNCLDYAGDLVLIDANNTIIIEGLIYKNVSFYPIEPKTVFWSFIGETNQLYGNNRYLIPIPACTTEEVFPTTLRCYQDNVVGLITLSSYGCFKVDDVLEIDNKFSIYPNPASSIVFITNASPIKSATIFNNIGQLISKENYTNNTIQINIDKYPLGIYFLQITTDTQTIYSTFIKM